MKKAFKLDIKKAALLVIDMQKYFTDNSSHAYVPGSEKIILKIKKLQETFISKNRPVIMTQHINNSKNAKMMSKWWNDVITTNNEFYKLDDNLCKYKTEIIKKTQYDAFYKTRLETMLKSKKITQLVITGVLTNLCCETTARSAFMRNFEVFFVTDATASFNKLLHDASITNLSYGFATIIKADDI